MRLTKKDFIERSMAGDRFMLLGENTEYYYDPSYTNPFRCDDNAIEGEWQYFDGISDTFDLIEDTQNTISVAQYRIWCTGYWFIPNTLFEGLEECKKMYKDSMYSHHEEVPGSRVELPDYTVTKQQNIQVCDE